MIEERPGFAGRSERRGVWGAMSGPPTPPETDDAAVLGAALRAAEGARVILVVGATDTGKTTLVTRLAGAVAARGAAVAVVDADLGQSEIGPPTTIGLGRVPGPISRLAEAELLALAFVGATSPVRHVRETAAATAALVERARGSGFERVLVDTCGLVDGPIGLALKRVKAALVDPDAVLVLERSAECESVVTLFAERARPSVVRLPAFGPAVRRTQEERRRHRERVLAAWFAGAVPVELDLSRVAVRPPAGADLAGAAADTLVGLHDAAGDTLGLGRLERADGAARTVTLTTRVPAHHIAALTLGRATWGDVIGREC